MFCKVNIMLFSSLLNMITESLGRWVGGRWVVWSVGKWSVVGWSVVSGFNKTHKNLHVKLQVFKSTFDLFSGYQL